MRIVILGAGHWHVSLMYIDALKGLGEEIVAIADADQATVDRVGQKVDCPRYTDYEKCLEEQKPDFVFAHAPHYLMTELAHLLDAKRLLEAVRAVGDAPNAQRLGFILDLVPKRRLTGPVHAWVQRQDARVVRLRPGRPLIGARLNRRWQVLVNGPIEAEA